MGKLGPLDLAANRGVMGVALLVMVLAAVSSVPSLLVLSASYQFFSRFLSPSFVTTEHTFLTSYIFHHAEHCCSEL